jgi:hypothetical protein
MRRRKLRMRRMLGRRRMRMRRMRRMLRRRMLRMRRMRRMMRRRKKTLMRKKQQLLHQRKSRKPQLLHSYRPPSLKSICLLPPKKIKLQRLQRRLTLVLLRKMC